MGDEQPSATTPVACRCLISGRVQGVHYRASAQRRAREVGVTGHARNLPDGRVEVLACGPHGRVREFIEWLWIGPSAAKVTQVNVEIVVTQAMPGEFRTG
jgi:acylphosphatase